MPLTKEEQRKMFEARLIRLAVQILYLAKELRSGPVLRPIANQIIRSSGSVGANVIEGRSGSSRRDYTNFLQIALKSANETSYWLTLIVSYKPTLQHKTTPLLKEAAELANILGASVRTLKSRA